jgi:NAD(P)-dependent dehydrogenase (short-subunit alcohol dehydrogenase family)
MDDDAGRRVALVTGGGRGLGRAAALALAAAGARIVVNDYGVNPEGHEPDGGPARSVVAEIEEAGGTAVASGRSVADADSSSAIVVDALDAFGRLDILVNVAGIARSTTGSILHCPPADWRAMIDVHLTGTFNMCRHAIPAMGQNGFGRIINTASQAAFAYTTGQTGYGAVKGGVIGLTYGLARELHGSGITVNGINPAGRSRLWERAYAHFEANYRAGRYSEAMWQQYLSQTPPDFIGPVVAYLASDDASGITGELIGCGPRVSVFAHPHEIRTVPVDTGRPPPTVEELSRLIPELMREAEDEAPSYVTQTAERPGAG